MGIETPRAVPAGMQGIADMAVRREATPQDASSFLDRVFQKAGTHLDIFQSLSDFVEGVSTHQGKPLIPDRTFSLLCLRVVFVWTARHLKAEHVGRVSGSFGAI